MLSNDNKHRILDEITQYYLSSDDFNGVPLGGLAKSLAVDWEDLVVPLGELIEEERACVIDSVTDVNPHIMRVGYESRESQIAKLEAAIADTHACVYPLPKHLEMVVDVTLYEGSPYVLCLALGVPQLAFRAFELNVLEFYRNDPRYRYTNDDVRGQIYLKDENISAADMDERDRIFLNTFGFCYDEDMNRAVAVFVRYLADLSPEHQQIWKAKEVTGDFTLHPDYYQNTIVGDWGEGISIFDAFLWEQQIINDMAQAMNRPHLFRNDFRDEGKPVEFGFLVRPTLKEFNEFVHTFDKIISENINKKFFMNEIPYESEEVRGDGKVIVWQKSTLNLLDEWIHKFFRPRDWEPVDEMIAVFKEVRKKRQKPAHAINENRFDQDYFHEQRDLITRAYGGVRILRLILANNPLTDKVEIHPILREGKIWTY